MGETHTISFEPVNIDMDVDEDEKVLDAAFRQGIHLMHGCREGQCSACKSYVLDGELQMERYSTFACNDQEVEDGYILLCRAHAFSDCTIELLNFDEDELLGGVPIQEVKTQVTAIESVTKDIVSLRLKAIDPPDYDFKPGQYADLGIPGTEDVRSFSMATTPSSPGEVEFLIKKYPGGKFSSLLDDGISVDDEIALTGPYGSFTLKDGHVLPVVCIGGGAGMAPILSLLRHMSEIESTRPVRFYYGARTAEDIFYVDLIKELGAKLRDFEFIVCLSESLPDDPSSYPFEAHEGMVTDIVAEHEEALAKAEVYLCGPPPMVDAAMDFLDEQMVPKDQVFHDSFTSPITD